MTTPSVEQRPRVIKNPSPVAMYGAALLALGVYIFACVCEG